MTEIEMETATCRHCGRKIEREVQAHGLWKIDGDTACSEAYYHARRK
jgi:hypothetical protein